MQLAPEEVTQTIQVLTPMHRGLLGTINLNREMQSLLNPSGQTLERGGFTLRLGDKVMQLRNNYDKGVFNGDLGRIVGIDREDGSVKIDFFDKIIEYDADELDEINLAYATSVHKSQGSEYPAVVIPLHTIPLHDAAPQHSLYSGNPRQKTRRPGRQPQGAGHGDPQFTRGEKQYRVERKAGAGLAHARRS